MDASHTHGASVEMVEGLWAVVTADCAYRSPQHSHTQEEHLLLVMLLVLVHMHL